MASSSSTLLFLDLTSYKSHVELPLTTEGCVGSMTLKAYDFSGTFSDVSSQTPKYIQVKFSDGINSGCLTNTSGSARSDSVIVPFILNPAAFWVTPPMAWGIPICQNRPLKRQFNVEIFGDDGTYLTGMTRALLWIEVRFTPQKDGGTTLPMI